MVFASLRFDDAIHVKPSELVMRDEGLFGIAWQTKTERRRAGTKFVVPKVGFKYQEWLQHGWDLFCQEEHDRDYWIRELNSRSSFSDHPPTHQRSVQWLRVFAHQTSSLEQSIPAEHKPVLQETAKLLTAHSCRVTLLDAAVHAGRSTEEIGLQANWKNPGPLVLKYTRNRTSVPATMIKQLVRDMVQEQHPALEDADTVLVEAADVDLESIEFFIKPAASGKNYEYKFHAPAQGDSALTACSRFKTAECQSVGSVLPDLSVLCKACAKSRPDLVASFSSKQP